MKWFGKEVMPVIAETLAGAEFRVVGKAGADLLERHGIHGTALGYVDDPAPEMATWTAMVVPIRFGGGTRVKIAEAFARGIPVVSTHAGAFGYDIADRRELMLADSPEAFASACVAVAKDRSHRRHTRAGRHCKSLSLKTRRPSNGSAR